MTIAQFAKKYGLSYCENQQGDVALWRNLADGVIGWVLILPTGEISTEQTSPTYWRLSFSMPKAFRKQEMPGT